MAECQPIPTTARPDSSWDDPWPGPSLSSSPPQRPIRESLPKNMGYFCEFGVFSLEKQREVTTTPIVVKSPIFVNSACFFGENTSNSQKCHLFANLRVGRESERRKGSVLIRGLFSKITSRSLYGFRGFIGFLDILEFIVRKMFSKFFLVVSVVLVVSSVKNEPPLS